MIEKRSERETLCRSMKTRHFGTMETCVYRKQDKKLQIRFYKSDFLLFDTTNLVNHLVWPALTAVMDPK
jgi:hypothetical protein